MRTFIAVELPVEVIQQAEQVQGHFKRAGLKLRWVRTGHMHLTLRFLGEIAPERGADVIAAMRQAVGETRPLELITRGLGVFPGMRKPRVLWIGLGGQVDQLTALRQRLDETLACCGFTRDDKPFKAHVTLARIKEPVDGRSFSHAMEAAALSPVCFDAREIVLFRSDLKPTGPVYTPLGRVGLPANMIS